MKYVIGLDYGTDSVRAVVVDALSGEIISTAVRYYPRWAKGLYCDSSTNLYRQHPQDYIDVLVDSVVEVLGKCPDGITENVVGIAFDTTGSTPVFTDAAGIPLAMLPEFAENPNAMFVLWKDHTAVSEAAEINRACKTSAVDYSAYVGGIYSSEWFWAKALHILRQDKAVRDVAYGIVEHCDWMPALITGNIHPETIYRSRCAAGHKAMWHTAWGGLPPKEFFVEIDPLLAGFRDRLFTETHTADQPVGHLSTEWAARLGLSTDVVVAGGAFDCHIGAVGAGVTPRTFVSVIGTSTCDIMIAPYEEIGDKLIQGICGQVDGSVIPGMLGIEAGQSAFGDIYAWFRHVVEFPLRSIVDKCRLLNDVTRENLIIEANEAIIPALSEAAAQLPVSENAIVATDWMNGRRTPDANQLLKGSIIGLTLGSDAPHIFRALVEATAFGSRAIVERLQREGLRIDNVTAIGGIALKSPFVMQTLSDVLDMPIRVCRSDQACALGAAMFAATAAGVYRKVEDAQRAMSAGFASAYHPNPDNTTLYDTLYAKYLSLGAFTEKEVS
jgi:L-ribulokinase